MTVAVTSGFSNRTLAVLRKAAHELWVPPPGNVPGLDALRSLAILLVVSGHYYGEFAASRGEIPSIGRFPFFYFAWTGVDLFFVLSGYLIGKQLWRELQQRHTIDVPRFLLRRGLRIWPYYFAFVAWVLLTAHKPLAAFIPDLTFLSNYLPHQVSGGWSLSTEEQFYIFVPLLIVGLKGLIGARGQVLVIGALLLLLPGIRWLTLHFYQGEVDAVVYRQLIQLPFHTHSDALLAGLIIAWAAVYTPQRVAPLPPYKNALLPLLMLVTGAVLRALSPHLFGFSGLALIFGAATLYILRDRSWLTRLFELRVLYVTSRLSYGMYLNHFAVLAAGVPLFLGATGFLGRGASFVLGYGLAIVASMLVAACTFILIESPFLQLRERWLAAEKARRLPRAEPNPSAAG
jgi:peptidoglycan/LPS O-acetylase OafA/YrhL